MNNDDYSIAESHEEGAFNNFLIHFTALIRKRLFIYRRNYKALVVEVLIPVILVVIGFAFSKIQFFYDPSERVLEPSAYPLK